MPRVATEIASDPDWNRASRISDKLGRSKYPALWAFRFIREWERITDQIRSEVNYHG